MYHEPQREPKEPSGCLEALILTRAVFGILLWPLVAIVAVVLGIVVVLTLLFTNALLGLLALAAVIAAVAVFAWWDRRRHQPPL